jgi:ribosomal protein S18 acetylase RimI-like enzyme
MSDLAVFPISPRQTRPLRQAVLRPHMTLDELSEHESEDAHAVGAFSGQELISVGFVAPGGPPGAWRVRGMATAPQARGRGAGSAVLAALLAHARAHGATTIWCNARVRAVSLYQRAGLSVTSEQFEPPGIGPHVRMEWREPQDAVGSGAARK